MLVLYEDVKHCRRTGAVHQSKLSLALQLEAQVMNLPVGFETAEPWLLSHVCDVEAK